MSGLEHNVWVARYVAVAFLFTLAFVGGSWHPDNCSASLLWMIGVTNAGKIKLAFEEGINSAMR